MSVQPSDINTGSWGIGNLPEVGSLNVSADPNSSGSNSFFNGIGDAVSGLAGLFNNGVNIFKSVVGQYNAAKQIASESIKSNPTVVVVPSASSSLLSSSNLVKIGVVVAVGAFALFLIKRPATR
ncbi:MAG: hypothetical protein WC412_07010 [Candidatus Omnitrophota bacterium]